MSANSQDPKVGQACFKRYCCHKNYKSGCKKSFLIKRIRFVRFSLWRYLTEIRQCYFQNILYSYFIYSCKKIFVNLCALYYKDKFWEMGIFCVCGSSLVTHRWFQSIPRYFDKDYILYTHTHRQKHFFYIFSDISVFFI